MDDLNETPAADATELERVRVELARREARIDELEAQAKVFSRWEEDLRRTGENLDARLLRRDREIAFRDEEIAELRRIQLGLLEELEWRRGNEESLRETEQRLGQDIEYLQGRLAAIEQTRLWRFGQRYWRFKAAGRRAFRRGSR